MKMTSLPINVLLKSLIDMFWRTSFVTTFTLMASPSMPRLVIKGDCALSENTSTLTTMLGLAARDGSKKNDAMMHAARHAIATGLETRDRAMIQDRRARN